MTSPLGFYAGNSTDVRWITRMSACHHRCTSLLYLIRTLPICFPNPLKCTLILHFKKRFYNLFFEFACSQKVQVAAQIKLLNNKHSLFAFVIKWYLSMLLLKSPEDVDSGVSIQFEGATANGETATLKRQIVCVTEWVEGSQKDQMCQWRDNSILIAPTWNVRPLSG